jgi:tRNA1Val (adenine37-N6)-methyltransferase
MSKDYSQPDFYRFNSDSLELVRWIKINVPQAQKILDLGAGCGIIGLELANYFNPEKLVLIEFQESFADHLRENIDHFSPAQTAVEVLIKPFSEFYLNEKYDLIVSNPPYYFSHSGLVSPHPQRAIARTFLKDSWEDLIMKISQHLGEKGKSFIILKYRKELIKQLNFLGHKFNLTLRIHPFKELIIVELLTLNEN